MEQEEIERRERNFAKLGRIQEAATAAVALTGTQDASENDTPVEETPVPREVVADAVGGFLRHIAVEMGALPLDATLTPERFLRDVQSQATATAHHAHEAKFAASDVNGIALVDKRVTVAAKLSAASERLSALCGRLGLSWADVGIPRSRVEAVRYVGDVIRAGFARKREDGIDPVEESKSLGEPADFFEHSKGGAKDNPKGLATAECMVQMCREHSITWEDLALETETQ